jgi:hypothetical protein
MKLVINLELCYWKQSFYKDTEPEMKLGLLIFTGVAFFQTEPSSFSINSNEILDVNFSLTNEDIKIVLTNDDDVGIIMIKAENVFWK